MLDENPVRADNPLFRMLRRTVLVLIALVLAGCASSSIDPQTKSELKTLYVEPPQLPGKPSVVAGTGGAMAVVGGAVPTTSADAEARLGDIVNRKVMLSVLVTNEARRALEAKGYKVVPNAAGADATVRFVIHHGLGVASVSGPDRGIAMTVNTEVVRLRDNKRLIFAIANQIKDPQAVARVRTARYEDWFTNESLVIEQYRVATKALVEQSLQGL
jgi:hypothetical protein